MYLHTPKRFNGFIYNHEKSLKIVQQKIPEHIDKHVFLLYTTINRWLKPAQRETTYIIQDYK